MVGTTQDTEQDSHRGPAKQRTIAVDAMTFVLTLKLMRDSSDKPKIMKCRVFV